MTDTLLQDFIYNMRSPVLVSYVLAVTFSEKVKLSKVLRGDTVKIPE